MDVAAAAAAEMNGSSVAGEDACNGRRLCDAYCVSHGDEVVELAEGQYEAKLVKETQRARLEPEQVPRIALLADSAAPLRRRHLTQFVQQQQNPPFRNTAYESAVRWACIRAASAADALASCRLWRAAVQSRLAYLPRP